VYGRPIGIRPVTHYRPTAAGNSWYGNMLWRVVSSKGSSVLRLLPYFLKQLRLSPLLHAQLFSHIARMPDETDAKILTAFLWENWRLPGRPRTTWMKTTQQNLKSNNLSLNEAMIWLRSVHSRNWCLCLALYALLVVPASK